MQNESMQRHGQLIKFPIKIDKEIDCGIGTIKCGADNLFLNEMLNDLAEIIEVKGPYFVREEIRKMFKSL